MICKIQTRRFRWLVNKKVQTEKWQRIKSVLNKVETQVGLLQNTLCAIYLIETTARPLHARLVEYLMTTCRMLLCFLIKLPLPSYTIGRFQIGLPYILKYAGRDVYEHVDRIREIELRDIVTVWKAIRWEMQVKLAVYRLIPITRRAKKIYHVGECENDYRAYVYIGEQYNGQYSYGLFMQEIADYLNLMM